MDELRPEEAAIGDPVSSFEPPATSAALPMGVPHEGLDELERLPWALRQSLVELWKTIGKT